MKNRPHAALAYFVSFAALLVVLWFVGSYFHVTTQLGLYGSRMDTTARTPRSSSSGNSV